MIKISKERVRQIETKALEKLKIKSEEDSILIKKLNIELSNKEIDVLIVALGEMRLPKDDSVSVSKLMKHLKTSRGSPTFS